ncbi:MAG: YkgJ family cysteine cluster protein [Candidatus Omnitrophota bacterium]
MFRIKQYLSGDFCLSCLRCCRYNCKPSIWAANILQEEKRRLNLPEIELIRYQSSYICCFLDPGSNFCQIYAQRPLECRLYPFLLNRCDEKIYLSLDLNCPATQNRFNSKEFKKYLHYLIKYFKNPSVLITLRRNRHAFSAYPAREVLNLTELDI